MRLAVRLFRLRAGHPDSFTDGETTALNVSAEVAFQGPGVTTLVPLGTADIAPGATAVLSGTAPAPLLPTRDPNQTDAQYLGGLGGASYNPVQILGGFTGVGSISFPVLAPALTAQKSGPPQGNAGLPLPYTVQMQNVGAASAGPIQIVDTVGGQDVGAQVTAPPTIAPGMSASASLKASSPLDQTPGPYTDQAAVTWKDRNGNLYGPISSAFTTNLAPPQAGYLTITGAPPPGIPQVLGSPLTLTVSAIDQTGNPAANLPVQFVVTGANPQTVQITTDADGTASFSYDGPKLGSDTVTATATINGPPVQANASSFTWVSTVPPNGGATANPCTDRSTPLDVMLLVDDSPSMFSEGNVAAVKAATAAFIGDLDPAVDQVGATVFMGFATLDQQLTSNFGQASAVITTAIQQGVDDCTGFCGGGTGYLFAFQVAQAELQGSRHRPGATPVAVLLSDGGNTGPDYAAELAAVKAAGIRVITLGFGANVDVAAMRSIASSSNDYFYAPSGGELAWTYGNIVQDTCRTVPPLVSAGGDQGLYEVRLPAVLTLQGEAHGAGTRGDLDLTSTWSELSGPAPVAFADASSPVTDVVFTEPGTYVLQLEASDGFLITASQATVTVDPAASLVGASLAVALSSPGPLAVGTPETLTATLTDAQSHPIGDFAVQVVVTGANPVATTLTTNAAGVATFSYAGAAPGTDALQAIAIGGTSQLASPTLTVNWTATPAGSGSIVAQGWLGSPGQQATVKGLVPITVAAGVTVASGTLTYWPATAPTDTHVLNASASGGPGATLATLDTTALRNGTYIIDLTGTDSQGNQQDNELLVTVAGDFKPGREVVDQVEFTVPLAGLPITIGRRYDSLDKDQVGDFGNGWSLEIGHPDLEVDPFHDVTLTMPGGRRVTFDFGLQPVAAGAIVFGFLANPVYVPEPGVFGTLTSDGCNILTFNPNADSPDPICFASLFDPTALQYAPTTYKYTDPDGVVYTMGADGTLKTIQDRNNNVLTFTANGITSNLDSTKSVTFTRDGQGRITKILTPVLGDFFGVPLEYDYTYDTNGNLIRVDDPPTSVFAIVYKYGYDGAHRLTSSIDPDGHPAKTSTYDDAGRLASDTDALGNVTKYAYDVSGHTTTTTYPDTGVLKQTFDDNGMLLSQTDQMGRTTTHAYDANRNELKRTNALGEATTYTYDANGNQTSSKNAVGDTTTTTYNAFSEPVTTTSPIGNTTTIAYDDQGVPTSYADSMGPLASFTSSEHGLPTSVTDAAGNSVFLNYDDAGDLTARTDRLGRTTQYTYTGLGQKRTMTDPLGGLTTYGFDFDGRFTGTFGPLSTGMKTDLDPLGLAITHNFASGFRGDFFTYDADNHLTNTNHISDDGTSIKHAPDFRGNELSTTDEIGNTTSRSFDLAGQLVQTTNPDGTFTVQAYDALGRLQSKTDERGNTTTYAYEPGCDCTDRMISVTDPLGRTTSMTYDGMSRKTSTTDANGHQTFYAYDLRGHLIETDYADSTATHDTYDALGRRTASTDQTGATTFYGYDAEGQLISVTDPLHSLTQYAYDANGNLTSVTDANNHTTTYAYDAANRKISRTLPLGMTETFAYDVTNNVTSHVDFRGKTATYNFDRRYPAGRMTSKAPDASLAEPTVSYAYNATSTRSSMTDASGNTTYGYDPRNRLLTKATPEGTLTYTYDASGNVASIDSSNTNGTSVGYAWDAANQLVSVTDNRLGGMTTAAYTATGRPASLAQPNGVSATYEYDSLDRVTSMAWKKAAAPAFASWVYTYSQRGQRLTSTDVTGREAAYGYDAASRLTSETVTGDGSGASENGAVTYSTDPVGNRLSRASTLAALSAQSFDYDSNDEVTTDTYDLNGNTTSSGGHTYTYDFEKRLTSKDGGAVAIVYDGDANRVAKSVGGITMRYLVDDLNPTKCSQVLEEIFGTAVQVRYAYGNVLMSQTRSASGSPATSFYGYDAHRNITVLTDVTGSLADTYDYDAWGNLVGATGSTPNRRLYEGQEFDPDLGLTNLRARQYSPNTGRFFTLDR
ncbi:MAG TPA: VWA domain-containing protein [Polyangia bacterium]|nr:VWA domain-containing protein [Polyangia bacterium]